MGDDRSRDTEDDEEESGDQQGREDESSGDSEAKESDEAEGMTLERRRCRPMTCPRARARRSMPTPPTCPTTPTWAIRRPRTSPGVRAITAPTSRAGQIHRPFTGKFDEIVEAEDLCEAEELERLRSYLDKQLSHLQGVVARLANRLQRLLLAQQNRAWEFDLDEACSTGAAFRVS